MMGMMPVAWLVLAVLVVIVLFVIISRGTRTRDLVAPQVVDVDWEAAQDDDFQNALERGNKIEAIKIYREHTGLGLKESKDAVEYLLRAGVPVKKRRQTPSIEGAAGVRDLLEEGRKDEAVELYAQFAGVDSYTARDAVEQIEREMRLGDAPGKAGLSAADEAEVRNLLAGGNKIAAVKRYRELTRLGLKEAKDAVEDMARGMK
jgi:ribosomal protein L7/L12